METTGEVDVDVKPVPSLFELSEKQIIDACDKGIYGQQQIDEKRRALRACIVKLAKVQAEASNQPPPTFGDDEEDLEDIDAMMTKLKQQRTRGGASGGGNGKQVVRG